VVGQMLHEQNDSRFRTENLRQTEDDIEPP
jgi:hypothetical protein